MVATLQEDSLGLRESTRLDGRRDSEVKCFVKNVAIAPRTSGTIVNQPIIFDKQLFLLQNIHRDNNTLVADFKKKRLLIFDGYNFKESIN